MRRRRRLRTTADFESFEGVTTEKRGVNSLVCGSAFRAVALKYLVEKFMPVFFVDKNS